MSSSAGGCVATVVVNLAVLTPAALGASLAFCKTSSVTLSNSGGTAVMGLAYTFSAGSSAVGSSLAPRAVARQQEAAGANCTYSVTYNATVSV